MLINTVILFIKDLLPIFILLVFLKVNNPNVIISRTTLFSIFILSLIGVVATFNFLPLMSELWDGAGIEIIQSIGVILAYFCIVLSTSYEVNKRQLSTKDLYLILVAIVIFTTLNASMFFVFLDSYIVSGESLNTIIAGVAIGLGICLSFSYLLFFILAWLNKNNFNLITHAFWALFLTGQISQVVKSLQQVDIIQSSKTLWDSSTLVADSSEYGHLLNTLLGYEARPSPEFIMVYLASLLIIFSYTLLQNRKMLHTIKQSAGEHYEL